MAQIADLADGGAAAIADHGGGDAGALAAVFAVDVLDHLLAPLVLEIDVDVGRLAAVFGNEAGEQEIAFVGIDRGDAEAKADRAVGCGAAALAEYFLLLPARERNDVVDGEKVAGVTELGDHGKLAGKLLAEIFQMLLGGLARRHRLVGIFVFELGKREAAGFGDASGTGDGVRKLGE